MMYVVLFISHFDVAQEISHKIFDNFCCIVNIK